jgi:succinate dehydrogenase/fumarate reductase-like Fe-S protein
MVTYHLDDISPDMSFLEMLDVLNEQLMLSGDDPVAFDSACREGICGACGLVINGIAHGPQAAIATCQLQMRSIRDAESIENPDLELLHRLVTELDLISGGHEPGQLFDLSHQRHLSLI